MSIAIIPFLSKNEFDSLVYNNKSFPIPVAIAFVLMVILLIIHSILFMWLDFAEFDIEKQSIQYGKFYLYYTRKERLTFSIPFTNIESFELNQDLHEWSESTDYMDLTLILRLSQSVDSKNILSIHLLHFPKLGKIQALTFLDWIDLFQKIVKADPSINIREITKEYTIMPADGKYYFREVSENPYY